MKMPEAGHFLMQIQQRWNIQSTDIYGKSIVLYRRAAQNSMGWPESVSWVGLQEILASWWQLSGNRVSSTLCKLFEHVSVWNLMTLPLSHRQAFPNCASHMNQGRVSPNERVWQWARGEDVASSKSTSDLIQQQWRQCLDWRTFEAFHDQDFVYLVNEPSRP